MIANELLFRPSEVPYVRYRPRDELLAGGYLEKGGWNLVSTCPIHPSLTNLFYVTATLPVTQHCHESCMEQPAMPLPQPFSDHVFVASEV